MNLVDELTDAGLDPEAVTAQVERAVAEDLPGEDVTSAATLDPSVVAWADLVARGDGVVAGTGSPGATYWPPCTDRCRRC